MQATIGHRVGIVVVTFNSRAHFARLAAALEGLDTGFDLIVFDNASLPAQRPNAADFPKHARIIQSDDNLGFAAANNRAVSFLNTDFIALLNPDAFPESNWLGELLGKAMRDPMVASVGSTQIAAERPTHYDGLGDCYHAAGIAWRSGYGKPRSSPPPDGEPFSACAAAALYRMDAWREARGFDEAFFCYSEDVDLGFRLRLLGWRIEQAPKAIVAHVGGASSGARSYFAVFHGTRNRIWTFVKNMPGALFWLLAPAHIALGVAFLVIAPLRGTGAATWRGTLAALGGMAGAWRERKRVQNTRRATIGEIGRALTWSPMPLLNRGPALKRPSA